MDNMYYGNLDPADSLPSSNSNPIFDRFLQNVADYTPMSETALQLNGQELEASQVFHSSRFTRVSVCKCLCNLYEYVPTNQTVNQITAQVLSTMKLPSDAGQSDEWQVRASGVLLFQICLNPYAPQTEVEKAYLMMFDLANTQTSYRRVVMREEICRHSANFILIKLLSTPDIGEESNTHATTSAPANAPLSISQSRSNQIIAINIPLEVAASEWFGNLETYQEQVTITINRDVRERYKAAKAEYKRYASWWKKLDRNSISTPHSFRHLIHLEGDESSLFGTYSPDVL